MGIEALYRKPRTSIPARKATIYPYLLSGLALIGRHQGTETAHETVTGPEVGNLRLHALGQVPIGRNHVCPDRIAATGRHSRQRNTQAFDGIARHVLSACQLTSWPAPAGTRRHVQRPRRHRTAKTPWPCPERSSSRPPAPVQHRRLPHAGSGPLGETPCCPRPRRFRRFRSGSSRCRSC